MNISSYSSQKIKVLSFVAIMMVLYIHAVFTEAKDYPMVAYVQEFCAFSGLSFVANPLFFCISGFLFYLGVNKISDCYPKIAKRAKTLMVPYLVWNIIFVLWYVILGVVPGVSSYINSDITGDIMNNGSLHGLYALFVVPASFQLWFLRDLIIYVLLSPLIYIIIKELKVVGLILIFVAGTVGLLYLPSEIKIWGAFFFTLGGYIAIYSSLDKIKITKPFAYACLFIYLLNAVLRPSGLILLKGTEMVVELCGLIAVWGGYDFFVKTENKKVVKTLAKLGSYSFFIYLFHEPTFNIIKKLGIKFVGCSEPALIVLYLLCPFIMAAISITVAILLQKIMPKVYSIIVGGR